MKKIIICLFSLLLLLSACAKGPQSSVSGDAELPTISGDSQIQLNSNQSDPEALQRGHDTAEVTLHRVDPDARKETSGAPLGATVFSVGKITGHARRTPFSDDMQEVSLPAESVTVAGLTFSAQETEDGVTVTLLNENCIMQQGKLERTVSEFSIGFGESITIVVQDGGSESGYLFCLKNA